jgi:hypothetical protein
MELTQVEKGKQKSVSEQICRPNAISRKSIYHKRD